jgi:hypothetical protein
MKPHVQLIYANKNVKEKGAEIAAASLSALTAHAQSQIEHIPR